MERFFKCRKLIRLLGLGVFVSFSVSAQDKTSSGKVTDESDNSLLPGVTVTIKDNANKVTLTDDKGQYQIPVGNNDVLVFTSIGYESKQVPVSSIKGVVLNVALKASAASLDEVVVV